MEDSVSVAYWFNETLAFMQEGGSYMWIILVTWIFGIVIVIERASRLLVYDTDGSSILNEIQKHIISGDIKEAIKICSGSKALLPKILKNGLKRSNQSTEQIQNAIDATALECIPKVERRLNYLSLIANVSTLLGLLGTIWGLIEAFQAVSAADPSKKAELLAGGISKAMNTTALGLLSAISIMVAHAILTAKSEKIIGEMDEYSVKLLDLLGTKKEVSANSNKEG